MKSLQIKSNRNINSYYKTNGKYRCKKALLSDATLPLNLRIKLMRNFQKTKSVCRVRHRCIISNRARALIYTFKLSRIKFREKASFGLLMGVRKGVW